MKKFFIFLICLLPLLSQGETGPVLDMAEFIGVEDAGDYYTSDQVEAALQEIGAIGILDSFTAGSVIFSNGVKFTQDNDNLFWDNVNKRLGIGTESPSTKLEINQSSDSNGIRINGYDDRSNYWGKLNIGPGGQFIIDSYVGFYLKYQGSTVATLGASYMRLNDNYKIAVGSNDDPGVPYNSPYWHTYNSSSTQYEFWGNDVDGGETDGIIWLVNDGTDDFIIPNGNIGIDETIPSARLEVNGDVLVKDKIAFTQDDKNEYIDSLNDGYMDYGATTAHRFNNIIRGTTSLWYSPPQHVEMASANPGASGANWITADADTLGGWQITADAHILEFRGDVHSNWDEATDLEIKVIFESNVDNTAGNVGDTTDFQILAYYKGEGETANKTQTITQSCVIGQIADHEQHTCTAIINWDEVDNVVEIGDKFTFVFNLVTGTSEVADVTINHIHFRYRTNQVNVEA